MRDHNLSGSILDILPPVMRVIRNEMRGIARPELTVAQFRILARLNHTSHTNKQLAEWMGISAASMCRTVDVLVKRNFVAREADKKDRREVTLFLTPKGVKKYESIKMATQKILHSKLAILKDADRKELERGLAHLQRMFLS